MINEKITDIKITIKNTNDFVCIKNNPVVKATILSAMKKVPIIGELIDGTIDDILTQFQQKKRNELLDVILVNGKNITSEMVNDVEFIMNFAKTIEAVNRLSNNDKIKYFGNLLRNTYLREDKIQNDVFQEYLDLIDRLSYREIRYLIFLYEYENQSKKINKVKTFGDIEIAYAQRFDESQDLYSAYGKLVSTGLVEGLYTTPRVSVERQSVSNEYEEEFVAKSENIKVDYYVLTSYFYEMMPYIIDNEEAL
ncbi:MAG: hypothetical protein ACRCUS_00270 [Anaerovoracaceae bacterium]